MKKYIYLLVLFGHILYAQTGNVGINTTTPNPSAILDLNSSNKGLLVPRISLQNETDITTIASPAKGLVIYNTNTTLINGEGFYVNYGTSTAAQWTTMTPHNPNNYQLDNVYSAVATTSVRQLVPSFPSTSITNNAVLGLGLTVTIPALTTAQVIVTYSTPIGFINPTTGLFGGYMGVLFLKDGAEAPSGSRKYAIPQIVGNGYYTMLSVGATYTETITNNTTSALQIIYSLNGYIEKSTGTQPATFIFNMFSDTGSNFNWGKGAISAQVFKKSL